MNPHVSAITLAVRDLDRAKKFYSEGLGCPIQQWGGYFGYFADPDGYLWKVAAP